MSVFQLRHNSLHACLQTLSRRALTIYIQHTQYDEIISWSSLYDSASIEAKKMIINSMIKRVDVYRNYELNVELNMNIRQFFLGMEETESYPITA